jgi:hypothetical protein
VNRFEKRELLAVMIAVGIGVVATVGTLVTILAVEHLP